MRINLPDLLNKMGLTDESLEPFETIPMDYFNEAGGTDFTANISMSGDGKTVEAEIQMIDRLDEEGEQLRFRQLFAMSAKRERPRDFSFVVEMMRIRGEEIAGQKPDWLKNGCRFFKICVSHIQKGMIPDFDVLYKAAFGEEQKGKGDFWSGGRGSRNLKNDQKVPKAPKPPRRF